MRTSLRKQTRKHSPSLMSQLCILEDEVEVSSHEYVALQRGGPFQVGYGRIWAAHVGYPLKINLFVPRHGLSDQRGALRRWVAGSSPGSGGGARSAGSCQNSSPTPEAGARNRGLQLLSRFDFELCIASSLLTIPKRRLSSAPLLLPKPSFSIIIQLSSSNHHHFLCAL